MNTLTDISMFQLIWFQKSGFYKVMCLSVFLAHSSVGEGILEEVSNTQQLCCRFHPSMLPWWIVL